MSSWRSLGNLLNILLEGFVTNNKEEPRLNRVGRPAGGALTPCDDHIAQQVGERLLFPRGDAFA